MRRTPLNSLNIFISERRVHCSLRGPLVLIHRNNHTASACSGDDDRRQWQRRRVVITGLGAITPLGPDMETTWKSVLQNPSNDTKNNNQNNGITTLYHALQQQNLSPAQFEQEWQILQSLSCQVAASVPSDWISNHPNAPNNSSAPWNDGRTSRFVQLALIAAKEAIASSGLDHWLGLSQNNSDAAQSAAINSENEKYQQSKNDESNASIDHNEELKIIHQKRRETIGVSVGNGMSSTRDISVASSTLRSSQPPSKAHRKLSPHFVPQILPNSPSARIAIHHQLMGPNLSHSEACAAGACAIGHAVELIQSGRVEGMVAGGCESAVEALGLVGFGRLRALSSGGGASVGTDNNDAAYKSSRPFDSQRNGFVLAEGAAMLVLEEYHHAVSRGAPILAEVLGVGYSGDAFHITAPETEGSGAARAMVQAVEDAARNSCQESEGLRRVRDMNDVDYINAHATSTPIGDVSEIRAIRLALSSTEHKNLKNLNDVPLLVSSTKGATGKQHHFFSSSCFLLQHAFRHIN